MRSWLTIRALLSIADAPRGPRERRGPGGRVVSCAWPGALTAALLSAGSSVAGCSAPDGRELFVPFELAGRGVGGDGGMGSSGAANAGAASVTTGMSGEGQGGLGIPRGGAGGTIASGASGGAESLDAGVRDAAGEDGGPSIDAAPLPPLCLPEDERCDGIDNDCDGEIDPGGVCAAQCAGFTVGGRGYMFCSSALARGAAQARCQAEAMRLVWLETPQESEAVLAGIEALALAPPAGNTEVLTHIGGSDAEDEGEWFWVGNGVAPGGPQFWEGPSAQLGGEVVGDAYVAWANLEPNDEGGEDCAVVSVFGSAIREPGEWDDRSCALQLPFVCEIP